jgi:hypothetical protein
MQFHRPAQRLLVQGVLASTSHLVRELRDGAAPAAVRRLMAERRRMLGELGAAGGGSQFHTSVQALNAAIAESDRTVEALIG